MKKTNVLKEISLRIPDSIASSLILFLSIQLQTMEYGRKALTVEAAVMVLLAVSRLMRTLEAKADDKVGKAWTTVNWIMVALYLTSAVTILIVKTGIIRLAVTTASVVFTLVSGRIHSIMEKRTLRNVLMNVAETLVILLLGYMMMVAPFELNDVTYNMVMGLIFSIWSIIHIISIFLSRLNLSVIKKIIKRTYAVEILFWLLLLILAFSFVLQDVEEGIPTYLDALWYCFTLITTIGFGDFTATTVVGRVLSVILGLYGIICVALITSIIVTFYGESKDSDRK